VGIKKDSHVISKGGLRIMKKCLAILFSATLLLVALVVLSGCSPKAQPAQPQQSVQPAAPATQPEVATQTVAPTVAPTPSATTTTTTTTTTTSKAAKSTSTPAHAANAFTAYVNTLPGLFNPASAQGVNCVYQFNVTGSADPGLYWVKIANGTCTTGSGAVSSPTITINVGEQLWFGIVNGSVDGTSAFLTGQYNATPMSSIGYLQNMKKYFTK
jgi:putative sterol carrier protein